MAIKQQWAIEGKGAEDNTPQHSCVSPVVDTFYDFENGIQKIVDNDPNCERSLKFEHVIQNAITAYKQLYQRKLSQA